MGRSQGQPTPGWDRFYSRTHELPVPEHTREFLARIPEHGSILDLGAGSGRFAAAFRRDRADLHIEALDNEPESMGLLEAHPDIMRHVVPMQSMDFKDRFDGIWAFNSLFFLEREEMPAALASIRDALKLGGTLDATFVTAPTPYLAPQNMTLLKEEEIRQLLSDAGLTIREYRPLGIREFGEGRWKIPLCRVIAQRGII